MSIKTGNLPYAVAPDGQPVHFMVHRRLFSSWDGGGNSGTAPPASASLCCGTPFICVPPSSNGPSGEVMVSATYTVTAHFVSLNTTSASAYRYHVK
eukprot:1381016-Rhodomonas_salina.1